MTLDRARTLGIVFCVLITGVVIVSLISSFQQLILHPFALFGSVGLATIVVGIILAVALVPSRRNTGLAQTITGPNGRWLFVLLILAWCAAMGALALAGLSELAGGAFAFLGLLAGVFIFMGFIWSVIGE